MLIYFNKLRLRKEVIPGRRAPETHLDKPAQGFGLIWEGRIVCFYSYESDLGDGWEDPSVHNDPENIRKKALEMGANIIQYAFSS